MAIARLVTFVNVGNLQEAGRDIPDPELKRVTRLAYHAIVRVIREPLQQKIKEQAEEIKQLAMQIQELKKVSNTDAG